VAGGTVTDETAADAVVAVGDSGLRSVATDPPGVPVLPVTDRGGRHLIARESLRAALTAVVAGDARIEPHPVFGVRRDGTGVGRALREVTLMTAAPGGISEYAIRTGRVGVAAVRADGVVVATPLGSDRYAGAAGGTVLVSGDGASVVPVAPFSTDAENWVLDAERGVGLSVEREGDVALFLDGTRCDVVGKGTTLTVDRDAEVELLGVSG
jgi:NAD+ kinase